LEVLQRLKSQPTLLLPSQVDTPAGQFAQNVLNVLNLRENKSPVNTGKHPIITRTSEHFCLIVTTAENLKNSLSLSTRHHFMEHNWLCEPAILVPTFILRKVHTFDDDNVEEQILELIRI
jgi:hypothetical protein